MAHLQSYAYPGWGEWAAKNVNYTQAIRVGDRIMCSGQGISLPTPRLITTNSIFPGGWDGKKTDVDIDNIVTKDLEGEIAQAFENVDYNLKHAGGKGWSQVYRVVTYSTDIPPQHEFIVENLKKWMPNHKAVWTEVGVKQLGSPLMHFEIEVEAHDEDAGSKR